MFPTYLFFVFAPISTPQVTKMKSELKIRHQDIRIATGNLFVWLCLGVLSFKQTSHYTVVVQGFFIGAKSLFKLMIGQKFQMSQIGNHLFYV
jgi:hypothetical protein